MMDARKTLFMDVHVLQTVPPSCINRDDTGSPKTAVYGGVTRARVSSQCWKHAMRLCFQQSLPAHHQAVRTKHVKSTVAEAIRTIDSVENAEQLANALVDRFLKKDSKDKTKTSTLYFMGKQESLRWAKFALKHEKELLRTQKKEEGEESDKKKKDKLIAELEQEIGLETAAEIALFGRMVAEHTGCSVDACAQVAHSISTHRVYNEFDYFTAVDDHEQRAAAHIDTAEFNSSTLYRYATVAVHELAKTTGEDTAFVIRQFLDAFVRSMPTGKQNTFANRTPVDAVYVTFRRDQPVNLVGAFEKPVSAGDSGYVEASMKRLVEHAGQVCQDFVDAPQFALGTGRGLEGAAQVMPFRAMLDAVEEAVRKECEGQ